MDITHKTADRTLYVSLRGEIDESRAGKIRAELDALFSAPGLEKAVIDMSGITFMDSTGIGMLIGRYKTLKARRIPLMIASPSVAADKILSLSGIYDIMPKIAK